MSSIDTTHIPNTKLVNKTWIVSIKTYNNLQTKDFQYKIYEIACQQIYHTLPFAIQLYYPPYFLHDSWSLIQVSETLGDSLLCWMPVGISQRQVVPCLTWPLSLIGPDSYPWPFLTPVYPHSRLVVCLTCFLERKWCCPPCWVPCGELKTLVAYCFFGFLSHSLYW